MTTWHASTDVIETFATSPRSLDPVVASSFEAHLLECDVCRAAVHACVASDDAALRRSWDRVAEQIDQPRPSLAERVLHRVGFDTGTARLVAATPVLRWSGVLTIAVVAAGAALASRSNDALGPLLVIAPLTPLAAVAAVFGSWVDPAGEAGSAAPLHGPGLVLRRAAAVSTFTFAALLVASLGAPSVTLETAAWVLPALALTLGALALATRWPPGVAASALAAGWIFAVATAIYVDGPHAQLAQSAVFGPLGQSIAAICCVAAAVGIVVGRDAYATAEVSR
jgi:hypothetical protein